MKAVFVDPSGRRRRVARRVGVCLAVPAVGYVALLASTMLGGPTVHTPWVPVPDGVRQVTEPRPTVPATTPGQGGIPTPSVEPTQVPTDGPTEQVADRTTPSPGRTVGPSSSIQPTTLPPVPPTQPTVQPSTPGTTRRPTAPPGRSSHSPTVHPTPGPKKTT